MSNNQWRMEIYGSHGQLWERIRDEPEASLREQGIGFTTVKGQARWSCLLFRGSTLVAKCHHGKWVEVPS